MMFHYNSDKEMEVIQWKNHSNHYESFLSACIDAISNNKIIEIENNVVITIDYSIVMKSNSNRLIIRGIPDNGNPDHRPIIIGSGHSVFQIGGRKTTLVLENLVINHECNRYYYYYYYHHHYHHVEITKQT